MKKLWLLIPLLVLVGFVGVALLGLMRDKAPIVTHTGKNAVVAPIPLFEGTKDFSVADYKGKWLVVNFFASWCAPCLEEHAFFKRLSPRSFSFAGVAYKDKRENLKKFLKKNGNPFDVVAFDENGMNAIEWGLTGVPETFLIAPDGMVAAYYAGPITAEIWKEKFSGWLNRN